jgi:hypothetical protein
LWRLVASSTVCKVLETVLKPLVPGTGTGRPAADDAVE